MTNVSDSGICCAIVPNAPAGATPNCVRRERQVAFALRRRTDFVIASLICDADGMARRARGQVRACAHPAGSAA